MKKKWIVGTVIAVLLLAIGLPVTAKHFSGWSLPANLGPTVNATSVDTCPCITKNGLSLYFASSRPATFGTRDIYVSQRASEDDPWGTPQPLGPNVNTPGIDDRCPYVTPDGKRLIFVSAGDFWMSVRQDKKDDFGWGKAFKIAGAVNSARDEQAMWGFEDGASGKLVLYFGSNREAPLPPSPLQYDYDVFQTTMDDDGNFTTPVVVSELKSAVGVYDSFPVVRKDGLELFLTSGRANNVGVWDIWMTNRNSTSEPWLPPVNLGAPVNQIGVTNMRSALSWDGETIIFTSNVTGQFDLYRSERAKVTGKDN